MRPCSLIERVLIIDTLEQARKKEELLQKNEAAARNLLLEISRSQVSYVTERTNESTQ